MPQLLRVLCGLAAALPMTLVAASLAQEPPKQPADYRKLVRDSDAALLLPEVKRGEVRISELRPAEHYVGADWLACLMTDASGTPRVWALFFRDEAVVHVRGALPPDRCDRESFAPLKPPPPGPPTKPPKSKPPAPPKAQG
jgi:hypothetical protein